MEGPESSYARNNPRMRVSRYGVDLEPTGKEEKKNANTSIEKCDINKTLAEYREQVRVIKSKVFGG